ncbi:hypothetical protein RB623_19635 [Mesorhizobium sp. LHD-90]|uniref:hypothetical protein n=1 Tax=Mesorhizobium sp. LHD-90 TaxID=3071414 RepID=UPI0027E0E92C|nr:hypothetical protein [Mesorhizobium sp. LHD-90]MDQ6436276.1 hypothetical protein [Mesorhizobium sp. LHD-90]
MREIVERAAARAGLTARWRRVPWPATLAAARLAETIARLKPGRPEPRITAYALGLLAFTQTLDTTAAQEHLGFRPAIGFDEGLARTFAGGAA